MCETDYSGYPDCRPAFYEAMNEAIRMGTKDESRIRVKAPFVNLKKKDIVLIGKSLGVPFEHTWSCYRDGEKACGRCDSCALRQKAFAEADAVVETTFMFGRHTGVTTEPWSRVWRPWD